MNTKKMLEFAYSMRTMWENNFADGDDINSLRKMGMNGTIPVVIPKYDNYKKICDTINDLEHELEYNEAKSNGRKNEKTRTSAAKKLLKCGNFSTDSKNSLSGYLKKDDGRIILCNGYVLCDIDPVIGIPETPDSARYPDFTKTWDINGENNTIITTDDISGIKQRLSEGYAVSGTRDVMEMHWRGCDLGLFVIQGKDTYTALNANYVLWATDLLGGSEWRIKFDGRINPCIIEGERGRILILPVNSTRCGRVDKEVE